MRMDTQGHTKESLMIIMSGNTKRHNSQKNKNSLAFSSWFCRIGVSLHIQVGVKECIV